jgi:hypothetical protein
MNNLGRGSLHETMCIKQEFQLELCDIACCNFLSPRRGEPNVMHNGRFFVEPMLFNSDIVKSDAIDPPRPFPVIINELVHEICIKIFA